MSFWTSASIKFTIEGEQSVSDIEKILGHIESYDDKFFLYKNYKVHVESDDKSTLLHDEYFSLPEGSEGTLDFVVLKTTNNRTIVKVCGGLRDVWSTDGVTEWFDKVIDRDINGGERYIEKHIGSIIKANGWAECDCGGEHKEYHYKRPFSFEEFIDKIRWIIYWYVCDPVYEAFYTIKDKIHKAVKK